MTPLSFLTCFFKGNFPNSFVLIIPEGPSVERISICAFYTLFPMLQSFGLFYLPLFYSLAISESLDLSKSLIYLLSTTTCLLFFCMTLIKDGDLPLSVWSCSLDREIPFLLDFWEETELSLLTNIQVCSIIFDSWDFYVKLI